MKKQIQKKLVLGIICLLAVFLGSLAYSHCQVPCGIYGDEARFTAIGEHITTIEKSMNQIEVLAAQEPVNTNQIVRWVNNKEKHADEISHIVSYYFMAQRVKLPAEGDSKAQKQYVRKLALLHQMLVYSMKAKQTTDMANVEHLKSSLNEFHKVYSGKS
ncbi:MAG: superoxide dismutase [Ni] [Planctomycetota bacterium]|jgi:nickel superoxide dismutase